MKESTIPQDKSLESNSSLKKSHATGVGVPVYTIVHDDRSPDYESAQFQDDWKDWEPNSWGY